MKRFKVPLIATAIIFVAMVLFGVISIVVVTNSSGSNREKERRASLAGAGCATLGVLAIAPFWLYTAFKIGQERRNKRS